MGSVVKMAAIHKAGVLLEMIKFQHTIFAMPFALIGMMLAARGLPDTATVLWIVACCVFARTAAMCFNRWADAEIDARNPRTAARAIPAGQMEKMVVLGLALVSSALFVGSAGMLNSLALALSPVALVVLLGYSYCKRFTSWSHFVLGLALGIAPVGAWVAVRGDFGLIPILLCIAVLLWTAGFDLIYSCQDVEVDREQGLFSIPARYGVAIALWLARLLHVACIASLLLLGAAAGLHVPYYAGVAAVACLLVAEHLVVNPQDLRRIELAFFTINSWVGVVLFIFTASDIALYR
ncbi:MAG: UbiA-like polyprenyltransferase [Candidatus Sumerlaeaceae bacterium]